jgi:hypothetical protein
MKIGRGNRSTRRKSAPVPHCPSQIPHDLTRTTAVGNQRITAWAGSYCTPASQTCRRIFLWCFKMFLYQFRRVEALCEREITQIALETRNEAWWELVCRSELSRVHRGLTRMDKSFHLCRVCMQHMNKYKLAVHVSQRFTFLNAQTDHRVFCYQGFDNKLLRRIVIIQPIIDICQTYVRPLAAPIWAPIPNLFRRTEKLYC